MPASFMSSSFSRSRFPDALAACEAKVRLKHHRENVLRLHMCMLSSSTRRKHQTLMSCQHFLRVAILISVDTPTMCLLDRKAPKKQPGS